MKDITSKLEEKNISFEHNFDTSKVSTIRLGEKVKLAIFPKNIDELIFVLKLFYKQKIRYHIFGNLSNVLICESLDWPVIFTYKMQDEFEINGNSFKVSAGTQNSKLQQFASTNNIGGFEKLAGIPATIGGMIKNNAGAFGVSISDNLISVQAFVNGKVVEIDKSKIEFRHHSTNLYGVVILSASFWFENKNEYDIIELVNRQLVRRSSLQPKGFSLGSVYKKIGDKSAGFFIERAGLKNFSLGGIVISSKHANFFINNGNGTIDEFLKLQQIVEHKLLEQFGVTLIPEIEKVGKKDEITCRPSYTFKE